jgi:glycine betaine/choline ABC-type transport system substrate-binding protein
MSTLAQIVIGFCLYAGVSFVNASTETAPTVNVSDKVVIGSKNFGESFAVGNCGSGA